MSKGWEVDKPAKCVTNCDHVADVPKHKILITKDVQHVIQAMLHKFPKHEWQMMLTGYIDSNSVCICKGYYIPKQEVKEAYVKNLDCIDVELIAKLGIVAGIHSHVNMHTTPSGTDIEDSVMSLINYHIITNNHLNMNGMRKTILPCGKTAVVKCDVLLENAIDLDTLPIEGLENVQKMVTTTTYYPPPENFTENKITTAQEHIARKNKKNKTFVEKYESKMHRDYDDEYDAEVIRQMQANGYGCY